MNDRPPVDFIERVETSLVTIPVSVRNRRGGYVADLRRENFRVFEDGIEQEIAYFEPTGKPITVVLALDISDSTKISAKDIREAAIAFLDQLRTEDRVLVVAFDKYYRRIAETTNDKNLLGPAIRSIKAGGGTSLYDAVESVMNERPDAVEGRRAIVMLTDGIDTSSSASTFESTIRAAGEHYASISTIQYEPEYLKGNQLSPGTNQTATTTYTTPRGESISSAYERGTRYLRLLSSVSGGTYQLGENLDNLRRAFGKIADELRQQYSLGFYPNDQAANGKRRKLKVVTIGVTGASVRSRTSYLFEPAKR